MRVAASTQRFRLIARWLAGAGFGLAVASGLTACGGDDPVLAQPATLTAFVIDQIEKDDVTPVAFTEFKDHANDIHTYDELFP